MDIKSLIFSFMFFVFTALLGQESSKPLETVKKVDLNRYVGLWYEIAKIPNRFQKDCQSNTTAEYSLRDDGRINVKNSCSRSDGKRNVTEGVARIVENSNNSKLEVSFFSILGIRPVWGDYWIIGLDDNYQYAVIGDPDRKYGWILSRTQELSKKNLEEAFQILRAKGYDTKRFEFTKQK
ncbi:MAG: lipocalin family protein [Bacteroidota bacterium]|nr:lipocalin family protein [Bacteroidota bacterium]MDP4193313.1 lipocalin family protein [Bacteroidota bacterium]MDP4196539.1 lipocalin family protein [Bacteroidota bacterium]